MIKRFLEVTVMVHHELESDSGEGYSVISSPQHKGKMSNSNM